MCNHSPITLHEHGGTTVICANCRRVLSPWRANGESGQCAALLLLTVGSVMIALFAWIVLVHLTRIQALADIIATIVFLCLFEGALRICEGGE